MGKILSGSFYPLSRKFSVFFDGRRGISSSGGGSLSSLSCLSDFIWRQQSASKRSCTHATRTHGISLKVTSGKSWTKAFSYARATSYVRKAASSFTCLPSYLFFGCLVFYSARTGFILWRVSLPPVTRALFSKDFFLSKNY